MIDQRTTATCHHCGAGMFADAQRCYVCAGAVMGRARWVLAVHPADSAEGFEVPLGRFPVTVGREADSDVRIADRRVSREHLVIEEGDGEVFVRELQVTNPGRLGDRPIRGLRRWQPGTPLILSGATLHLRRIVCESERLG